MKRWARLFIALLCVLALVGASTLSFAASVATTPCAHEQDDATERAPLPHKHAGASCLACCLSSCTALPDLPLRPSLGRAAFAAATADYWESTAAFSGLTIPPDLGPPRTGT
jgi:hypothetical protein